MRVTGTWASASLLMISAVTSASATPQKDDAVHQTIPGVKSICQGNKRDRIIAKVIRPAFVFRTPPTVAQIAKDGEGYYILRDSAVWKKISVRICSDLEKEVKEPRAATEKRIIIYVENDESNMLALEYPDSLATQHSTVSAQYRGRAVNIHSNDIRAMLDHSGREVVLQR